MKGIWIVIIVTFVVTASTFATTIHVPHQYPTIQEGINAAVSGDTVMVASGTYTGANNRNLDYGGREIVVVSQNGADSTIIDCENSGRGVYFHSYEGRGAILNGFAIINGSIDRGAGIYCDDVSPTIINCIFAFNSVNTGSWNYGGGLYARDSDPLIENCIFYHNSTENGTWCHGGGIYLDDSSPVINNCNFQGNYASGGTWNYGGGIYIDGGTSVITHCTLDSNWVSGGSYAYGGGINTHDSNPQISRCLITNNYAINSSRHYGGGVYCNGLMPVLEHCTISGNWISTALYTHGAGICCYEGDMVLVNTIVEGNTGGSGVYFSSTIGAVSLSYSDFYGNSGGNFDGTPPAGLGQVTGVNGNGDPCDVFYNIFLDPMFANPALGDYHLTVGSPCIDAGDPLMPYDPDGTVADIGMFYYNQTGTPDIAVSDTLLDFGEVIIFESELRTLTIYSTGSDTLQVTEIITSNPCFTTDFNPVSGWLAPGDSLLVTVTFTPTEPIMYNDTLTVFNNAGQVEVGLEGLSHTINVGEEMNPTVPDCFALHPPYPNPFNAQATIRYDVPVTGQVRLTVYDILGREVARLVNGVIPIGFHSVIWNAAATPSGVYFVVFESSDFYRSEKVVVLK